MFKINSAKKLQDWQSGASLSGKVSNSVGQNDWGLTQPHNWMIALFNKEAILPSYMNHTRHQEEISKNQRQELISCYLKYIFSTIDRLFEIFWFVRLYLRRIYIFLWDLIDLIVNTLISWTITITDLDYFPYIPSIIVNSELWLLANTRSKHITSKWNMRVWQEFWHFGVLKL